MNVQKLTKKKIAEIYGVSIAALRRWEKFPDFPGALDPERVFHWLENRRTKSPGLRSLEEVANDLGEHIEKEAEAKWDEASREPTSTLDGARLKKLQLEAQILEERLKVTRGEVVERSTASGWIAEIVALILQSLEMNDEELAELWEGQPAIKILEGRKIEREKLRNELTNYLETEVE